jgi:MFS family permease
MGVAAATGVSLAVRTWIRPDLVPSLGWRVAFIVGGLGGLLSFVLRRSLEESPEFARMKALAARQPFREVLRTHLAPVAIGVGALAATAGFNGLFFAHMAAYATGVLGYNPRQAIVSQTTGVVVHALGILAVGALADRVPPRALLRTGAVALMALAFPFYSALASRSIGATALLVLAGACAALVNGTFAVILTDLFPTRVRFSGVALVFNVAFTIFSGTAPLVATTLIKSTGMRTAPAFVMVACGLLTLLSSMRLSSDSGYVLKRASEAPVA